MVTASPVSRRLLRLARRYASADASVWITGETGVGKNAIARVIHAASRRRDLPFVTIDCPSLPPSLIEAALFGHERGAFTGATAARAGYFEQAADGTVYIDAIADLAPQGQSALLRLVEERRVTRIGGTRSIEMRARILAAADADVIERIDGGAFRADLFHRLRVLPLVIPPLRERPDDILPLARYFNAAVAAGLRRAPAVFSADAEQVLVRYHWPGNVRELRHSIERVLLTGAAQIDAAALPVELCTPDACMSPAGERWPTLDEMQHRYIEMTLHRTRGNQTRAAEILGISRKGLWEKRKRFGSAPRTR